MQNVKMSNEVDKIFPALLAAQKEMPKVVKDGKNPHFRSNYTTIDGIIESVAPVFNKHGIAVIQCPDGESLVTIFAHTSGQFVSSSLPLRCKDPTNPQALGSAVTYARRYSLASMALLSAEDDDGNEATFQTKGDFLS